MCDYCEQGEAIIDGIHEPFMRIEDQRIMSISIFDEWGDIDVCQAINFCPICGRDLRRDDVIPCVMTDTTAATVVSGDKSVSFSLDENSGLYTRQDTGDTYLYDWELRSMKIFQEA